MSETRRAPVLGSLTALVYVPGMILGYGILKWGILDGVQLHASSDVLSIVDVIWGPALDLLTRAFDVSPEIRAQARHDLDFETLRDLEGFQQLLEAPVTRNGQASATPRRSRRPRAGG